MKQQQGEWKKIKLEEVLTNPAFLGKKARLGKEIFELKCFKHRNFESMRKLEGRTSYDDLLSAFFSVHGRTPPDTAFFI